MPDNPITHGLKKAYESGKLDAWLKSGEIDQAKYDRAITRIRALELGVPYPEDMGNAPQDSPPADDGGVVGRLERQAERAAAQDVDAATRKKLELQGYLNAYESGKVPWKRGSGYVPGVGDVPLVEGPEWDKVKDKVPGFLRDFSLIPSRGAVWQEPTVEEMRRELEGKDPRVGDGTDQDHAVYREWADKKWAEAYDLAKERGEALYRARDINEKSPAYLQRLKRASELLSPLESFGRSALNMATAGASEAALNRREGPREEIYGDLPLGTEIMGALGFETRRELSPEEQQEAELGKRSARQNLERSGRVREAHPYAEIAGNIAGAVGPGLSGGLARGVDSLLLREGSSAIGGVARSAAAAFGASLPVEHALLASEEGSRAEAGLDPRYESVSREALKRSGVAALFGGLLAVPRAASKALRSPSVDAQRAADIAALEEAGGRTALRLGGVAPPPGYEAMARETPEGAEAGFRRRAADEGTSVLFPAARQAADDIRAGARELGDDVATDAADMRARTELVAQRAYREGESLDQAFDEQLASFAERTRKALNADLESARARHSSMNEAALKAEGAPPYPETPSPLRHIEDIEASRAERVASYYGLEGDFDHPTVSSQPILDKFGRIVSELSFYDGTTMPNTGARKFKDAIDKMVLKKIVAPEEAPLYEDVAIGMREIEIEGDRFVQVVIPRRMNARELDDFVQAADELAKMPNSPGPDAQRWAEVGAVAREMRSEAFPKLAKMKETMHQEMTRNEELLRSLGLQKSADSIEGVDQTGQLLNAMKSFANGSDFKTPDGMSIPRKEFERWLGTNHPEMLDDYMALRGAAKHKAGINALGVKYDASLPVRKEGIQKLQDALTGKLSQSSAVMDVFRGLSPEAKAARAEHARVHDIFRALNVNLGDSVTLNERIGLRNKLMEVAISGADSPAFQTLEKQLRPEQVAKLRALSKSAQDVDELFRSAGLPKDAWRTEEAAKISNDLFNLMKDYKRFGANPELSKRLESISPETKKFLLLARGSQAYKSLRNETRENVRGVVSRHGFTAYMSNFSEAINYHLDALYQTANKGSGASRVLGSPLRDPAAVGVGLAAPIAGFEVADTVGDTVYTVGSAAANMLVHAAEWVADKYGPKE